ncbi:hypothetical protein BDR05DRAFT_988231 [Suillus weaverae]|nr:hypothetical protein BDR05DRAFT_988231 [Suillus weaverae]
MTNSEDGGLTGTTDFARIGLDVLLLARCSGDYDQTRSKGSTSTSFYGASKAATQSFTQALASEPGSYSITVNDYAPEPVDMPDPDSRIPLGRITTTEDIANLVSFFVAQGRGLHYWLDSHD